MLVSFHLVVVGNPGCPRFGMLYELARGSAEADNVTLDALKRTIDRAYENYRAGRSQQAVEATLTGVIVRENTEERAIVFRVQKADRIRLIRRPPEFMKAAEDALRSQ
jgi:hypothetical protein